MGKQHRRQCRRAAVVAMAACSLLSAVGCQVDIGGQTLPSPWYQTDDIQYFAPHSEFQLPREAAAQKAFSQDQALIAGAELVPVPVVPGAVVPAVPLPVPGEALLPAPGVAVPVVPAPADDALPPADALPDAAPPDAVEPDAFGPDAPEPGAEVDMGFDAAP